MDARAKVVAGVLTLALIGFAAPALARSAPPNDDFASATAVTSVPFADTVDNRVAGTELFEPQPSCRTINRTVWYAFSPSEDMNFVAEATGTFKSVLAVYGGTGLGDLAEVACNGGSTSTEVEFPGVEGQTYFIQLGSANGKAGMVDFKLGPATWQERVIRDISQNVTVPEQNVALVRLHGRQRASNPSMYDVTVSAAGQPQIDRGILTFGLVKEELRLDLIRVPQQSVTVATTLAYRYDSSQYTCLSDGGEGQSCTASSPIKDLSWLTGGEGSRAELIVRVSVAHQGTVLAERTVTVPYAGQVGGMIP